MLKLTKEQEKLIEAIVEMFKRGNAAVTKQGNKADELSKDVESSNPWPYRQQHSKYWEDWVKRPCHNDDDYPGMGYIP